MLGSATRTSKAVALRENRAYLNDTVKLLMASLVFTLFCATVQNPSFPQEIPAKTRPRLLIAECAEDGFDAFIPEGQSSTRIAQLGDIDLEAVFLPRDDGAAFRFVRKGATILSFTSKHLAASEVWVAAGRGISSTPGDGYDRIALTYSDGGAIGNFHVRVFQLEGDVVTDVSKTIEGAVADFRARHYCKPRGNNVTALKWIEGDLLLMTEVYPTGDCGPDGGHVEAYLVSVPDGKIQKHLTLEQLKSYPGVCLQNDDKE
jgi:hypothetical protein